MFGKNVNKNIVRIIRHGVVLIGVVWVVVRKIIILLVAGSINFSRKLFWTGTVRADNTTVPTRLLSAPGPLTYTFLREFDINEFVCSSDYQLIINFDDFGSENTWELTDDTGAIVYSGGPYDDGGAGTQLVVNNIALAAGCYNFTFFDSFGDGLFDGNTTGDYNLVCASQTVVSYASGVGNFGASNSTDFCVN